MMIPPEKNMKIPTLKQINNTITKKELNKKLKNENKQYKKKFTFGEDRDDSPEEEEKIDFASKIESFNTNQNQNLVE